MFVAWQILTFPPMKYQVNSFSFTNVILSFGSLGVQQYCANRGQNNFRKLGYTYPP